MPSSVIRAMQYRPEPRALLVLFRAHGGAYLYRNVPPEVWRAFRAAPSKGTFLNQTFKELGFRYDHVAVVPRGVRGGACHEELEWGESWALPELTPVAA